MIGVALEKIAITNAVLGRVAMELARGSRMSDVVLLNKVEDIRIRLDELSYHLRLKQMRSKDNDEV